MSPSLQFDGRAREELQQVAANFCASQAAALELIKTKQRKETRFQLFMQVPVGGGGGGRSTRLGLRGVLGGP